MILIGAGNDPKDVLRLDLNDVTESGFKIKKKFLVAAFPLWSRLILGARFALCGKGVP